MEHVIGLTNGPMLDKFPMQIEQSVREKYFWDWEEKEIIIADFMKRYECMRESLVFGFVPETEFHIAYMTILNRGRQMHAEYYPLREKPVYAQL